MNYPTNKTIRQQFETSAQTNPDAIALVGRSHGMESREVYLTYRQLDETANRLANCLENQGVAPRDFVGILADRSIEMIIGILGIIKSGCAYVPLNPKAPASRNLFILNESRARVVLTMKHLIAPGTANDGLNVSPLDMVFIDDFDSYSSFSSQPPDYENEPGDFAYVVFTSGSTGVPKGVPITNRNFCPLIHWGYDLFDIGWGEKRHRALQNLAYYFDWSVWEIFLALTTGTALYMAFDEILLDPVECNNFIQKHGITILHITPSQYQYLVNDNPRQETLTHLFLGAEKLTVDLARRSIGAVSETCRVFNMYGPTEVTIISVNLELKRDQLEEYGKLSSVPIGIASSNGDLLVLDENMERCGIDELGELYISGDSVAAGYLNDPEKTYGVFLPNPFKTDGIRGDRLYKTGDRVRMLPSGDVEFLGRIDYQVKIRGFRIELGEIENALLRNDNVREAVVIDRELPDSDSASGADKYLCAYIVPGDKDENRNKDFFDNQILEQELTAFLSDVLPDYMIPSHFMAIDKIPLNANRKLDRRALPVPETAGSETPYVAPRNDTEVRLAEIWAETLGCSSAKVGIDHHFFRMGGHSLSGTLLLSKIHKTFDVRLSLENLFKYPTIRELADHMSAFDHIGQQAIPHVDEKPFYPLSPPQRQLYILEGMALENVSYHIPLVFRMEEKPCLQRLSAAFQKMIDRHECFRTSFDMVDEQPVQRIHDHIDFVLHIEENGHRPFDAEDLLKSFVRPFNLGKAPLLRAVFIEPTEIDGCVEPVENDEIDENQETEGGVLLVDMHHIVTDGMSVEIFQKELTDFYEGIELPPLPARFRDYVQWLEDRRDGENYRSQETYWLEIHSGEPPVLNLPYDYTRPQLLDFTGRTDRFYFEADEVAEIRTLASSRDVTPYMVLLTAYTVLLGKLSGQEEMIVGTPTAGRRHPDLEGIIGMFINTLALRQYPVATKSFDGFLSEVKRTALGAFENQDYPFEELLEHVDFARDPSRNPLFDVMFVLQNMDLETLRQPDRSRELKIKPYRYRSLTSKVDMSFICIPEGDRLALDAEHSTRLFKRETVQRFVHYFKTILAAACENPGIRLGDIDILTPEERNEILFKFNNREDRYPLDNTLQRLVSVQASRTPNGAALAVNNDGGYTRVLTYKLMEQASDALALELKEKGLIPGTMAGIMLERSAEMIIGILGILKAGAGYVPINPENPASRVDYILQDSQSKVLICRTAENYGTREFPVDVVNIDAETLVKKAACPESTETPRYGLDDCNRFAYIIYTSGSTGNPKGVPITHTNLSPLLHWGYEHIGFDTSDHSVQNLSFYFDWSVWEIFMALTSGSTLYMTSKDLLMNAPELVSYMNKHDITAIHITPTQVQFLLETGLALNSLKYLVIGAEKLTQSLVERSFKQVRPGCRLFNMYGPTEATIMAAVLEFTPENLPGYSQLSSIPIGYPIANTGLLILDRGMGLCPVNVVGELYISGDGLAAGYLGDEEKTAKAFVPNPYRTKGIKGQLLYKTGDRSRWLPDGTIEFLGRLDHQVKIRGYRIELGEIEKQLLACEDLETAVVTARALGGNKDDYHICAYYVPAGDVDGADLRIFLETRIPDYMIPSFFIKMDQLPLNPNGKVNLKALPEPGLDALERVLVPPATDLEKQLVDIWSEALKLDPAMIGVTDNFFQLGGHSLKGTVVISEVHKLFNIRMSLAEFFNIPEIRKLAQYIGGATQDVYVSIKRVEEQESYPLSYAQRRLWILCQFEEDSNAYNIPGVFILDGPVRSDILEQAIKALVERHEGLRTVFTTAHGEPRQKIIPHFPFQLPQTDLRHLDGTARDEEGRRIFTDDANYVFDLENGPLYLFRLVRLDEEKFLFIFNIHHIVDDGWSQGVLTTELFTLYNGLLKGGKKENILPPLTLQYKDYSAWHNGLIETDHFADLETYWLEKFKDRPNGMELPLDHPRPPVQTFNGQRIRFNIDRETTKKFHHLCSKGEGTLFMGLLSLYSILLYKYTGQTDIIIGAPIAGRRSAELHPIVGFLVNTLVYRIPLEPSEDFGGLLIRVKEEALACYENQDYPFDLLIDRLEWDRDLSQSPLFNVMLAHNNADTEDLGVRMEGVTASHYKYEDEFNMSKFDLTCFMVEDGEEISVLMEYNSDLFDAGTVERMCANYRNLVDEVLESPDKPISAIPVLTGEEYDTVVKRFNGTGYPFHQLSLPEMVEDMVHSRSDWTAVVDGTNHLSYGCLNENANRLAHYLRDQFGVKPGHVVGLSMDRSLEMVWSILGIIKSGAGYVAVDPNYPEDRVRHMLDDSGVQLVITDGSKRELFVNYTGQMINVFERVEILAGMSRENPEPVNEPEDVLYVIYTSGTTGTPNGAMLSHHLLTNLVKWQKVNTTIDASKKVLQFTSVNFCVSFQEIMITLCSGGEVHLIGDIERQDIDYLMNFLASHRINVLYLPFSYLNFLFNESGRWGDDFHHHLRHIVTAGEQLKVTAGLKRFLDLNPSLNLHNHYGSSEMHVVTSYTLDAAIADKMPIPPAGQPVSNVRIYILDESLNPVPIGVWGELYVAGNSELLGYIKNETLTTQKLIPHKVLEPNGPRLYKSGDLGRWLPDGNIELKGRKDSQVKIRGFRIELGEIESKILYLESVKDCVVVVKEDPAGQKYLVAYIVGARIDPVEIRRYLSQYLPQYMVPKMMPLDKLPLMPNGKVDRERLPEPDVAFDDEYTPPRDIVEKKLAAIWAELLETDGERISIYSNFFEIGGHSLKATTMASEIHKALNTRVPLTEIFRSPSISEIAEYIRRSGKEKFRALNRVKDKEYYRLSSAQQRVYLHQQIVPGSTLYNMPATTLLEGVVDVDKLEVCIRKLIERHESFRTAFVTVDDKPVQKICHINVNEFEVERIGLAGMADDDDKIREVLDRYVKPFDLTKPPLIRSGVLRLSDETSLFVVDMHHIISDGLSYGVFFRELETLYGRENLETDVLEPLPIRYVDYAEWQAAASASLTEEKAYWLERFRQPVPELKLPYDFHEGNDIDILGRYFFFKLSADVKERMAELIREESVTFFTVILSMFYVLLYKVAGNEDIVVGTSTAGRNHADLKRVVGMFVNSLPLRNYPSGQKTFRRFLHEVAESSLTAFENQDYQYDQLVEELSGHDGFTSEGGNVELFKVMFSYFTGEEKTQQGLILDLPGVKAHEFEWENNESKFDFSFFCFEERDRFDCLFGYRTARFKYETIELLKQRLYVLIDSILADPDSTLADLDVRVEIEKELAEDSGEDFEFDF